MEGIAGEGLAAITESNGNETIHASGSCDTAVGIDHDTTILDLLTGKVTEGVKAGDAALHIVLNGCESLAMAKVVKLSVRCCSNVREGPWMTLEFSFACRFGIAVGFGDANVIVRRLLRRRLLHGRYTWLLPCSGKLYGS